MLPYKFLFLTLFSSLLLLGASSCARKAIPKAPRTLEEAVIIQRDLDGSYELTFKEKGAWKIHTGDNLNSIDWSKPRLAINGDKATIREFAKSKRMFFGIVSPDGKRSVVSERLVKMKGTPNFRDIGGMATKEGRVVNWGMIYRSSNLADLKKADMVYFNNLNIKHVCDFRYSSEIEKDPDQLPEGAKYHHLPIGGKEGVFYEKLKRRVLKEGLRRKEAKKEFIKVMELFADSAAHDFKPVMDLLNDQKQENAPLLYHCSGGKDRTGYMTMMILATLGVDKERIREEYLMSNYYRYKKNKSIARKARLIGVDPETLGYILVVQNDYFDAVFGVIENKYGGLENYLLEKYEITPEVRQQMIEKYTFDPNAG